jgi:hypothetical protein
MKPVGLVERAILNSSRRGNTVLDPFGGSGTTLIAADKTGRKARLMEIDPLYCDTIIDRWQQYTGKQALHARTGQTFDELRAQCSNVVPGVGLLAEDPNVTTGQER